MDLELAGRVAMVAAASRGLGLAVARSLADHGACVSMCSASHAINTSADEIAKGRPGRVLGVRADLASARDILQWHEKTKERLGEVELLFVNTGGPRPGSTMGVEDEEWVGGFESMVLAPIRLSRAVLPGMKSLGRGSILFSTSSGVREPLPNLALSNVLRASVSALSKTLAQEVAPCGVRVNQIIPGRIDTGRVQALDAATAKKHSMSQEDVRRQSLANIPLGRYGAVAEYADLACYLLSERASYVTGATVQVDGGRLHGVH